MDFVPTIIWQSYSCMGMVIVWDRHLSYRFHRTTILAIVCLACASLSAMSVCVQTYNNFTYSIKYSRLVWEFWLWPKTMSKSYCLRSLYQDGQVLSCKRNCLPNKFTSERQKCPASYMSILHWETTRSHHSINHPHICTHAHDIYAIHIRARATSFKHCTQSLCTPHIGIP